MLGEALARYMAEKEGLSAICLRIGAFQPIKAAEGDGGAVDPHSADQLLLPDATETR